LETDEFGLPAMRLSDFEGMMKWSPMETLPKGLKISQIVRTGLNDSQVFAYESAKWMVRSSSGQSQASGLSQLAGQTHRQLLAIQGGQGHFVNGSVGLQQQAEDIAVLMSLIKNRSNQYKMANRKNMRKGTRKNRRNMRKGTRKNMRK
jgi:protease II